MALTTMEGNQYGRCVNGRIECENCVRHNKATGEK